MATGSGSASTPSEPQGQASVPGGTVTTGQPHLARQDLSTLVRGSLITE